MSTKYPSPFRISLLAGALATGACQAQAEPAALVAEELRRDFATPDSRIDIGVGVLSGNSRRFGEFSGLNSDGAYGLFNLNLIKRDDASGTWLKLKGRNLGLENRELRFDHERQGDWSYYLEAGQLTRNEPWMVRSGLTGIGTTSQTVSAAAPKRDLDLKLTHENFAAGARKFLIGGFDVRVSFKQDEKHGDRMYGQGTPANMVFLAEPLDRTTRQWDVVIGYADKKLQLSGGYSGSSFENRKPLLTVVGGPFTETALPPSNEAHQIHLAGGYNISDSSRTSFKLSRTLGLQDSAFVLPSTRTGRESLDGRLVTTLAFGDLSLRPADRLDVHASLRYEDRDDQTVLAQYLTPAIPSAAPGLATAGISGFNKPTSLKQFKGTLEAGYQLEDGYRLVGTLEREQLGRSIPDLYRRVAFRQKTDETLARLELKRNLSETLNGAIAYIHSTRNGSDYIADTHAATAGSPTNQIQPLIWADRQRDKLRLTADWIPEENWSLQFIGDMAADHYGGRNLGPRKGTALFASADATYAISDKWTLSGWVSQERLLAEQTTHTDYAVGVNSGILWEARIRNTTSAWGIGLKGKPRADLELGADLSGSTDNAEHGMARLGNFGTAVGTASPVSLPDYHYRQLSLKLFADHALDRHSGVRASFIYDRRRSNDWTWAGFTYTDGTTVTQPDVQETSFLGLTYHYRWR